jgi:hypothetical protein
MRLLSKIIAFTDNFKSYKPNIFVRMFQWSGLREVRYMGFAKNFVELF